MTITLIPCPDCGHKISPDAEACPACGRKKLPPEEPGVKFKVEVGRKEATPGKPAHFAQVEGPPGSFRNVGVPAVLPTPEGPLSVVLAIAGADAQYLTSDEARRMAKGLGEMADALDAARPS